MSEVSSYPVAGREPRAVLDFRRSSARNRATRIARRPLQVFIGADGGTRYICVASGNHYWWNHNAQTVDTTTLAKAATDHWQAIGAARTVYLKRIRNPATDAATVTLENSTSNVATIIATMNSTPETKLWILGEVSATGVVTQWHFSGHLYEHRVS